MVILVSICLSVCLSICLSLHHLQRNSYKLSTSSWLWAVQRLCCSLLSNISCFSILYFKSLGNPSGYIAWVVHGLVENRRHMSRVVRKPAFCICENKDADQLRSDREADQRLCFRYTDRTIPLLPKSEISSL